ncbi:MAG: sulfotransferase domain-containing protein [Gemmatimonadota bacterium]
MKRFFLRALNKRGAGRHDAAHRLGLREVHPDDTFIVSFPKSGNTWVRFLIAAMQHPDEEISFRNIECFVPDIHKSRKAIEAMPPPRIIKSHTPCFESYPRFVYVLRDGRDAMISFFNYALGERSFRGSLREFVGSEVAARYGTWSQHAMGALKQAEQHPDRVLAVRYEDLISSPLDQARRIADFCRLNVEAGVLQGAVARCQFSRLQEVERRHGGEVEENDFRFFRRGVQGQWRNDSIAMELAPFIEQAEEALSSLGYPR